MSWIIYWNSSPGGYR